MIYGANNCYTAPRSFTNGVDCSNGVFGDPLPGVHKYCYTNASGGGCNNPSPNSDQIGLYEDADYCGAYKILGVGEYPNPGAIGLANDSISSVKVGSNVKAILCKHDNFQECEEFLNNDPNLSNNPVGNDSVSSAKVQPRVTTCPVPSPSSPNGSRILQTQSVNFTWSGSCSQYRVKYWGGPYSGALYSSWVGGSSWTPGTLWCGNYSWQVQGKSGSGAETDWSATLNFTVAPNTPTGLTANAASQSQINLSWNGVPGQVEGYKIYRNGSQIDSTTGTSYQVTGLSCSTNYSFYVRAYAGGIDSDASNTASARTQECPASCPGGDAGNSFSSATLVYPPVDKAEYICPVGDEDWYRFAASAGQAIQITLTSLPGDYDLYLYRPNGSRAGMSIRGGNADEAITVTADASGEWRAQVIGYAGAFSASDAYMLHVETPSPQTERKIGLEAELGSLTSPMALGSNAQASSCGYVSSPEGNQGSVVLQFLVTEAGNYHFWARGMGLTDYNENSFYASVDGGARYHYEIPAPGGQWHWSRLFAESDVATSIWLTAGSHTIRFDGRERGARLDKVVITNRMDYQPGPPDVTPCITPTPSVVEVQPSCGRSNTYQAVNFQTIVSDPDGWQDIKLVYVVINSTTALDGGAAVAYNAEINRMVMRNEDGTAWLAGGAPGSAGSLETSRARLDIGASSKSVASNQMTLTWHLQFKDAMSGAKNVYILVVDREHNHTGWQAVGSWGVGTSGSPPCVGAVSPPSGRSTAGSQTYIDAGFGDPDGWEDIKIAYFLIGPVPSSRSDSVYLAYNQDVNKISLRNDQNSAWLGGVAPGTSATIQNSNVIVDVANCVVSHTAQGLTIRWALRFKSDFRGTYNMYAAASDNRNYVATWQKKGTWTIQ